MKKSFISSVIFTFKAIVFFIIVISLCLNVYFLPKVLKHDTTEALKSSRSYESLYSLEATQLRIKCHELAKKLIVHLKGKGWVLACSESVTGGTLASSLALAPGASSVFAGSGVCYRIEAKKQLLNVPDQKEDDLYDLQTAEDMAKGTKKLYTVSEENKVSENETYSKQPMMTIATTGRAVTWDGHWEGGVFVAVTLPNGQVYSQYFKHVFSSSDNKEIEAKTKEEGMLTATYKALQFALSCL